VEVALAWAKNRILNGVPPGKYDGIDLCGGVDDAGRRSHYCSNLFRVLDTHTIRPNLTIHIACIKRSCHSVVAHLLD